MASDLLNLHLLLPLMQCNTLFLLSTSRKFKQSLEKTMSAIFKTEGCLAQILENQEFQPDSFPLNEFPTHHCNKWDGS